MSSSVRTRVVSPSTASDMRPSSSPALVPTAHLFVVMSCSNPLEPPSRHALQGLEEVHVGRGAAQQAVRKDSAEERCLTLSLADAHVSSAHARLVRRGRAWVLEDLGSKNGSSVNGLVVRSQALADGDSVQVGHTLLIFRESLPTPVDAPVDLVASACAPTFATLVPNLAREFDELATAATSNVPIVLLSETGTGKEVLARTVHSLSQRKGDFVAINCGGLPVTLVESVLFGHKRGAFSGAAADHPGLFRAADEGTLLLDEVGDMPASAQAAVLRTLQNGEVLPVGATRPVQVDVRIVSATHRDVDASVAEGRFREDLLARLSGFTFRLPPLRERREDIGVLVSALLRPLAATRRRAPTLSPEAGMALLRYRWPRNVRELEKCLARAVALARDGRIEVNHLAEDVRDGAPPSRRSSREELRDRLLVLLREGGGNVSFVAKAVGTSRWQVHRWMKRFGIELREFRR